MSTQTEAKNEYYVSYRTSTDGPTSTCIARAACVSDVLAFFGSRGAVGVTVTPKKDAPSWMGEGKNYSTVECPRVPVTVEFDGGEGTATTLSPEVRLECARAEYERLDARHAEYCKRCDEAAGELAKARFTRDVCARMMDELAQEIADLSKELGI